MYRRLIALIVALMIMGGLTACGSSTTTTSNSSTPDSSSSAATQATPAAASCPTENTKAWAKTRFVANVALIVGTTSHFIVTPYKAGKLNKDASGHTFARIKAGAAALFVLKQAKDAVELVKANPLLCKSLLTPLTNLVDTLGTLKSKILGGDLGAIAGLDSLMGTLTSGAKSGGLSIVPKIGSF